MPAQEFPNDNLLLWLTPAPPAVGTASATASATATASASASPSASAVRFTPAPAPAFSCVVFSPPPPAVVESAPSPVAVDDVPLEDDDACEVEVIEAFDDEDFAHATFESILPTPLEAPPPSEVRLSDLEARIEAALDDASPLPEAVIESPSPLSLGTVVTHALEGDPPSADVPSLGEAVEHVVEGAPPVMDDWARYLQVVASVARDANASEAAIELLPALVGEERLDTPSRDAAVLEGLADRGLLSRTDSGFAREAAIVAAAQAWKTMIGGGEADLSACGSGMLDEWTAALVAKLVGSTVRVDALRRELRSRGVCAFGLVIEAA